MTKFGVALLLFCMSAKHLNAQKEIEVLVPETYELSNIILALTDYGREDEWEVQKRTDYYNDVVRYFEPVKAHPLLQKVNYSRTLWEDYLSFRTDAIAYKFDTNGRLIRTNNFYANKGHNPFDENLDLINDFIQKSKYRDFYKAHNPLYSSIVANYSGYYMLDTMKLFLEKLSGISVSGKDKYQVILSPLVGRMNCHRNIDSTTTADFPSLSVALIKNNAAEISDQAQRAVEIHTIFTEMDHGYVNPITDLFGKEVELKFKNEYWDRKSGYKGLDCFNEYMTWALYDIFVEKYFPQVADSVSIQWHYQNGERGFFASNLFAVQVKELYRSTRPGEGLKDLYPRILAWTARNQLKNEEFKLLLPKADSVYLLPKNGKLKLDFSTGLKRKFDKISCIVMKLNNGKATKERSIITITPKDIVKWNADNSVTLQLEIPHEEFALILNWWGCRYPVLSDHGVMLASQSYILLKKDKS
ncbi:MAG: DUF4932 domain-containing protein [Chitinophagaceae bacterium]